MVPPNGTIPESGDTVPELLAQLQNWMTVPEFISTVTEFVDTVPEFAGVVPASGSLILVVVCTLLHLGGTVTIFVHCNNIFRYRVREIT